MIKSDYGNRMVLLKFKKLKRYYHLYRQNNKNQAQQKILPVLTVKIFANISIN